MYNRLTLIGHVGQRPEIRAADDTSVANFRLATTKIWTDDAGETHESTEWHTCSLWRDDLAAFAERVDTGTLLMVEGELRYRDGTWAYVRVLTYRVLKQSPESRPGDDEPTADDGDCGRGATGEPADGASAGEDQAA